MGCRYLLLGGTGAMGDYLKDELLNAGDDVYITSRRPHQSVDNLHYLCGDAHDTDFLKSVVGEIKPDVIVDFMVYGTAEFRVRFEYLLSHTRQYIYVSSYRVFANTKPLIEASPRILDACDDEEYLKTDEYALAKARQENLLRESPYENWTIVRPSITYSRNRFQFGCLEAGIVCFRALQGLPVVMPEEMLDKHATMTWAKDVARMIARLALNPGALREDFNVVTAESHTWREILGIYHMVLGMEVETIPMTDYLTICARYQTLYDRMFDRVMDNSKVLRVTGMTQTELTPIELGLARELEAFKRNPRYQYGVDVGASAKMDRMCHTHTSLNGLSARQKFIYFRCRYKWIENLGALASRLTKR